MILFANSLFVFAWLYTVLLYAVRKYKHSKNKIFSIVKKIFALFQLILKFLGRRRKIILKNEILIFNNRKERNSKQKYDFQKRNLLLKVEYFSDFAYLINENQNFINIL